MLQIYFPPNKHNSGVNNNPIKPQSYGENGYAYADIRKLMYSLPHVGSIEHYLLTQTLAPHGYYQCWHTPVIWRNKWISVKYYLVVDEFQVKYVRKQHAGHPITCIKTYYSVSVD